MPQPAAFMGDRIFTEACALMPGGLPPDNAGLCAPAAGSSRTSTVPGGRIGAPVHVPRQVVSLHPLRSELGTAVLQQLPLVDLPLSHLNEAPAGAQNSALTLKCKDHAAQGGRLLKCSKVSHKVYAHMPDSCHKW